MAVRTVQVSPDRLEEISFRTGKTISGYPRARLVDGDTTYTATYPVVGQDESEVVGQERDEQRAAYAGGLAEHDTRVVAGQRYLESDIPSEGEL